MLKGAKHIPIYKQHATYYITYYIISCSIISQSDQNDRAIKS